MKEDKRIRQVAFIDESTRNAFDKLEGTQFLQQMRKTTQHRNLESIEAKSPNQRLAARNNPFRTRKERN